MMKMKAKREIDRINRYERKWKIKTNEEKFKVIPLAQYKAKQLTINGKNVNPSKDRKFLGLKLQVTGLTSHVTEKINKSKDILSNLRRFSNLTPELKATLIKTLLIPVIEYPPVPLCSISKARKLNIKRITNKGS